MLFLLIGGWFDDLIHIHHKVRIRVKPTNLLASADVKVLSVFEAFLRRQEYPWL